MILLENVKLTAGSQRVMDNKKLVAGIADAVRDDAMINPSIFPAGFAKTAKTASDEVLAQWFLEYLDKIEREGYEGIVYSRDGVNSDWIARRYIAGSHSMEDINGVLNMNLRDFYVLKNRGILDPAKAEITRYNSIRELGKYLTLHYSEEIAQARDAAKQAALKKMVKATKLVDNDDYRIYTVFNWAAARTLGLGTQWCTANSNYDDNYRKYSSKGMLFQLYPKNPEKIDKVGGLAKKQVVGDEKYQFDAGSMSFMDLADDPVSASEISERFPYIYDDLVHALRANKGTLEKSMEEWSQDAALNATQEGKTNTYDIDEEIKKLSKFIARGHFTDKHRPKEKAKPEQQSAEQQPQQPSAPTNEDYIMEMDKDVKAMMESLKRYDQLLNEGAKKSEIPAVHRKEKGGDWKLTQKDLDKEEEEKISSKKGLEKLKKEKGIVEAEEHCDACDRAEKDCVCEDVMEGLDPDIAEWMQRLAKVGNLAEEKKPDADGDGVPDWADKKHGKDDNEEKVDEAEESEEEQVEEGADPEVMAWKARFDRLGKMG